MLPFIKVKPATYLSLSGLTLVAIFATVLAYVISPSPVHAAPGINQTISFQGKLTSTDKTNVDDGTYSVRFALYTADSGGTAIWTETQSVTTTSGIFRVSLGSVSSLSAVNFNQDSLYIGIKVESDNEMSPRIPLNASPYAFNAKQVNGLSVTNNGGNTLNIAANKSLTISNSLTFSGSDSTSFVLPTSSDTLVGLAASQILTNKTLSGAVLSGSITMSSLTTNGGLLYTNGSGVVSQLNAGTTGQCLQANTSAAPSWGSCGAVTGGAPGAVTFWTSGTTIAADNSFIWDNTNKRLGIGGTPDTSLHVKGSNSEAIIRIQTTNNGGTAVSQAMPGLELIGQEMNATNRYLPAIKFGTADSNLTTTNPKFGALIVGEATESYSANTDSGMGLGFYVTADNAGATPTPSRAMFIDQNGRVTFDGGISSGIKIYNATTSNDPWHIFTRDDRTSGSTANSCDGGTVGTLNVICFDAEMGDGNGSELRLDSSGYMEIRAGFNGGQNPDVAEFIPVNDQTINQGDILVATSPQGSNYQRSHDNVLAARSTQDYQSSLIGVVSTSPSIIVGTADPMAIDNNNRSVLGNQRAMAIAGRVPVKVSTINGSIAAGDPVTASTLPGFGMKATQSGKVVGRALQDFDGTAGEHAEMIACPAGTPTGVTCAKIIVLLNLSWDKPQPEEIVSGLTSSDTDNPVVALIDSITNTHASAGYSEYFLKADPQENMPVGTVTSLNQGTLRKAQAQAAVLGVVTRGGTTQNDTPALDRQTDPRYAKVGLQGQLAILVSNEQGQPGIGDKITNPQAVAGVAVKAQSGQQAIAVAMQLPAAQTVCQPITSLSQISDPSSSQDSAMGCYTLPSGITIYRLIAYVNAPGTETDIAVVNQPQSLPDYGLVTSADQLTSTRNFTVDGLLQVSGGLVVGGPAEFRGPAIFKAMAEFIDTVIFRHNVTFDKDATINGTLWLNKDTAGLARINPGQKSVRVNFEGQYQQEPVISTSLNDTTVTSEAYQAYIASGLCDISNGPVGCQDKLRQALLSQDVRFIITDQDATGFTVELEKPTEQQLTFSWIALMVKDKRTVEQP